MSNAWRILFLVPRVRPRLSLSTLIGIFSGALLPATFALTTRLLVAWDIGTLLYLFLALFMLSSATPSQMRTRAAKTDEGAWAVLFITVIAAVASIVAIVMELSNLKSVPHTTHALHFALGITTIVCSWLFVHTMFAIHYAHEFYKCLDESGHVAIEFPSFDDFDSAQPKSAQARKHVCEPDYWDFMYFAFVIGMTSQTSDVQITSPTIRRLALLQGIIAFFFNATLLALAVNTAASVL